MDTLNATKGSFFVTGGAVRPDALSYVERECDQHLLEALDRGEFCYVLTSRQMGKSSLVVHTAKKLRQGGVAVVVWDLTAIGQNLTPEQWYDGLCVRMGEQLGREEALDEFWNTHRDLGPCQRLFTAIRELVLPGVKRLIVFVDEIDMVRSLPFTTDEFFAAVRECYNRRVVDGVLERLTFCLLGVATPSDLIQDTRMTPFNVGQRIELSDFTEREAAPLAKGLEVSEAEGIAILRSVLRWTQGHPYLTQRLCQVIAEQIKHSGKVAVDRICRDLFLSHRARERDDNLIFVRERLLRNEDDPAGLLSLYRNVLTRRGKVKDDETSPLVSQLRLSGIVRSNAGKLELRNNIYKGAFDLAWIRAHMPDAEIRRQRRAFYKGLAGAATGAAVVLSILIYLLISLNRTNVELTAVTRDALSAQANALRLSGKAGQRYGALEAIRQAAALAPGEDLRRQAIASLPLPDVRTNAMVWPRPPGTLISASSPDFRYSAHADTEGIISVIQNGSTGVPFTLTGIAGRVTRLFFSPDTHYLAAVTPGASDTNQCVVWRLADRVQIGAWDGVFLPDAVAFDMTRSMLVAGHSGGEIRSWNLNTAAVMREGPVIKGCSLLLMHPGRRLLAAGTRDGLQIEIRLAGLVSGMHPVVTNLHLASPILDMAWHPADTILAALCKDQRIRLWSVDSGFLPYLESERLAGVPEHIAFSMQGHLLATSGAQDPLRLWDPFQGRLLLTYPDGGGMASLQMDANDRRVGFFETEDSLRFLDLASLSECRPLYDLKASDIQCMRFQNESGLLLAGHHGGLTIWDPRSGRRFASETLGNVDALAFVTGSTRLIISEYAGVFEWEWTTSTQSSGTQSQIAIRRSGPLSLSPGVTDLAYAGSTGLLTALRPDRVVLLDGDQWSRTREWTNGTALKGMDLSLDGEWLALNETAGNIIWILDTEKLQPKSLPVDGPAQLRFSPDSQWLAVGTRSAVTLWSTDDWRIHKNWDLPRALNQPSPVAFSPGGGLLAFARTHDIVQLESPVLLMERLDLTLPTSAPFSHLEFSPDERLLACAREGMPLVVWDLPAVQKVLAELGLTSPLNIPAAAPARSTELMELTIDSSLPKEWGVTESLIWDRNMNNQNELSGYFPNKAEYRIARAELWLERNNYEEAAKEYRECIKVAPNDDHSRRDFSRLLLSRSEYASNAAEARDLAEAAILINPNNADNHLWLGIASLWLEDHEQAAIQLRIVLEFPEGFDDPFALYGLSICEAQAGRMDKAAEVLERATRVLESRSKKYSATHAAILNRLTAQATAATNTFNNAIQP